MAKSKKASYVADDPLWYKDAIIYELHVRAFHDSDGDGIGDFPGLTSKLDYLQELGITALWILPFYPSPLKDDGYDIADYQNVNPIYGSMKDFDVFLAEAHKRGIRVITELVINHTSDQHAWFQRARKAPKGSAARDFYMWSDDPSRYADARIIFKDFEHSNWAYDPVAQAYYWHRFYSHQPDLNFDSAALRKAVLKVLDFWLDRGVDGMRLDAVPYLYAREGTNCENLPETHAFLKKLRSHVDSRHKNRMLLAEANQWPEDAAAYFGDGDECHMNFHFPLMPRLFMSLYMEDRFPIVDILGQTPPIHENSQWALFLRNHDELTLEMVTDEERDYMYRIYASDARARVNLGIRRRLAPLLENNRRRIELMNALLFSLPGTPVLYYGDELGMGDNVYLGDRNGVRTPMQWSADRNAGFSRANPQSLYLPIIIDPQYNFETVNVEAQVQNSSSLYWWMKRLIALRKRFLAFGRGTCEFLLPTNRRLLAFVRRYADEVILIVANLSRFVQYTELDLSAYRGKAPVELFGNTEFPTITDAPYFLSLGPHAFLWFSLQEPRRSVASIEDGTKRPHFRVRGDWTALLTEETNKEVLERYLPKYLAPRRWFRSKASTIDSAEIVDTIQLQHKKKPTGVLSLVRVSYTDRDPENYLLPLGFVTDEQDAVSQKWPHAAVAQLTVERKSGGESGLLCDAAYLEDFRAALLDLVDRQRYAESLSGGGTLNGWRTRSNGQRSPDGNMSSRVGTSEQSNTSMIFGDHAILKLYRRVEEGLNPDVEIGRHLTARGFPHTAPLLGAVEYRVGKRESTTIASLQKFVPNQGDAWQYTLDELERFFDRAGSARSALSDVDLSPPASSATGARELSGIVQDTVGAFLESVRLLGVRTAEMHDALAHGADGTAFEPESFTPFYRRALYQSLRNATHRALSAMAEHTKHIPADVRPDAKHVLESERVILKTFNESLSGKIRARRIRVHGDYHLGQVLHTGRDFVIIDFEGEPGRSLGERRTKRCALADVAGMLRSLQYAAFTVLYRRLEHVTPAQSEAVDLRRWARTWCEWTSRTYLDAYIGAVNSKILGDSEEIERLLHVYLLEKAIYELSYEMNNRPAWVRIPLAGIIELLRTGGSTT